MTDLDKRQKALILMASGKSPKSVAEEVGVSERTIHRWKNDPQFQGFVKKATLEACDAGIAKFASLFNTAAEKIEQIMTDPSSPPRLQLEAAKLVISYALQSKQNQIEELKAIEVLVSAGYFPSEALSTINESMDEMSGKIMLALKNGNGDNTNGSGNNQN
ncbi:MAG: helix-turn-helix domain-containing protein [Dolichospermum sp.]